MQGLFITGDTEHALVLDFMSRVDAKQRFKIVNRDDTAPYLDYNIIIDFHIAVLEPSVDTIQHARERTKACLDRFLWHAGLRYIYVICDGSVHDAVMVRQFRDDYGADICLLNFGILYGHGVPSRFADIEADIGSSDGIIRFVDTRESVSMTSINTASRAIYSALYQDDVEALIYEDSKERISVLASQLSKQHVQKHTHFVFC